MSKTKGNVVDPLEAIDESGADALRFALIHGAAPGNDQKFSAEKLENARNFANKLWNAARFVLGARPATIPADAARCAPDPTHLGPAELWLRSRVAGTVAAADRALADYAFGQLTATLYDAIWGEYCDWALELAKVRLADESLPVADREATWWTLVEALDTYLRLLHPVMPFLTEAIWGQLPRATSDPELLIVADWPAAGSVDEAADAETGGLLDLVRAIRNARAEARVEPGAWLPVDVAIPAAASLSRRPAPRPRAACPARLGSPA
jgi:valyl-tRNA synthetase